MATDDEDIDALFQLPLDQFTAARNALAKRAGPNASAIRELTKPPVAAWAVNQLYWRERGAYEALIEAAQELRRTHKAVLGGKSGDLRGAGRAHDQALDRAVKATTALPTSEGHPASDATRQAIVSTLRALPGDEAPGRLTRTLQPGGFEMLAGFPLARTPKPAPAPGVVERKPSKASAAKREGGPAKSKAEQAREAKARAKAKEAAAAARQALQRAEHDAQREEFERARAAREADKAAAAVTRARETLEQAQQELEEAERAASAADANRARAERRAAEADKKRAAAELQARAAAEELKALES